MISLLLLLLLLLLHLNAAQFADGGGDARRMRVRAKQLRQQRGQRCSRLGATRAPARAEEREHGAGAR